MSSKLDFRGVGKAFGQERAGCVGTYSEKPGLAYVLSWASQRGMPGVYSGITPS
mgnify:CR=1 FL=1